MENQSEKLDHQVAGLPSLCLASSRIQFSVHTTRSSVLIVARAPSSKTVTRPRDLLGNNNCGAVPLKQKAPPRTGPDSSHLLCTAEGAAPSACQTIRDARKGSEPGARWQRLLWDLEMG